MTTTNLVLANTLLNEALELSLKDKRVKYFFKRHYRQLSEAELEAYDTTCHEVIDKSYKLAEEALSEVWKAKKWKRLEDLNTTIVYSEFRRKIKQLYPWLSKENMSSLCSRGIYAALK